MSKITIKDRRTKTFGPFGYDNNKQFAYNYTFYCLIKRITHADYKTYGIYEILFQHALQCE